MLASDGDDLNAGEPRRRRQLPEHDRARAGEDTGYRHTIDDRLWGAAGDDLAAGGVIPRELSLAELSSCLARRPAQVRERVRIFA